MTIISEISCSGFITNFLPPTLPLNFSCRQTKAASTEADGCFTCQSTTLTSLPVALGLLRAFSVYMYRLRSHKTYKTDCQTTLLKCQERKISSNCNNWLIWDEHIHCIYTVVVNISETFQILNTCIKGQLISPSCNSAFCSPHCFYRLMYLQRNAAIRFLWVFWGLIFF